MTIRDPHAALERLAGCRTPLLIGVRHHSPACAAALPALLEDFAPERILVELPVELQPWLEWLGHPELVPPVALAAAGERSGALAFYPFAGFSPELVAIRWAHAHGVEVVAFDLPLAERAGREEPRADRDPERPSLFGALRRGVEAEDTGAAWDRLIEARAAGSGPEAIRRAALLFGWALRLDGFDRGPLPAEDLAREAHMRARLGASSARTAAVVGAFHAPALLPDPLLWEPPAEGRPRAEPAEATVTSLVPYAFELLDERSGYPAGIRDPLWQQAAFESLRDGAPPDQMLTRIAVEACRAVRTLGHVAGVPDAAEMVRVAGDLARLRGLPGAGRRELLEAITLTLGQGELLGRGRALARALQEVLVGDRRGRLARGTPRSGLRPHVEDLLEALGLPPLAPPLKKPLDLRLDPLRSDLDRRRHVALERLALCGIPYGVHEAQQGVGDTDSLTQRWRVQPTQATEAMVELAGLRGVTLEQAAEGALMGREQRLRNEEGFTPEAELELLERAAACGLAATTAARLGALPGRFVRDAGLSELVRAASLVERIRRQHVPGLPAVPPKDAAAPGQVRTFTMPAFEADGLLAAAVRSMEGLVGSSRAEDVRGLLELVQLFERQPSTAFVLGDGRLGVAIDALAEEGSPLMQGAGLGAQLLLGRRSPLEAGRRAGAWLDVAVDLEGRRALAGRLRGALTVLGPRLEADVEVLDGIRERVEGLADRDFLERLPALRDGFDALSPAARQRLLDAIAQRHGLDAAAGASLARLVADPETLAACAAAEGEARAWVVRWGLLPDRAEVPLASDVGAQELAASRTPDADRRLSALDRWRLLLGREPERLEAGLRPMVRALDELYGAGRGEGSRDGAGGGRGAPFPTAREWAGELEALFGERVREEVLGRAVERGRTGAALALSPDDVVPSVELLEQLLSLQGAMAEGQLQHLRKLVRTVVEALTRALAQRLQPALAGLATPRPTRRRTGRLDFARTVTKNLRHARREEGGRVTLVPEHPIFRSRARRSIDWRLILVVDVSGSMEASVIYSALMAAILSGVPALDVRFLAFSTDVIDLSERVGDPLGLLLEVQVGGGTHIAKALRHARSLITVPSRTLLVTVSDFEEGFEVGALTAEARALVESGVRALGLAALDDQGKPRYEVAVAEQLVSAGMPVAALTPLELAGWVAEQLR